MKLVIQRVNYAKVVVEDEKIGGIGCGLLVFLGISNEDTEQIVEKMLKKLLNLRIFEDNEGKTNLSVQDINGDLLIVSQFTLYADCRKGNRPSFILAGNPSHAEKLYEYSLSCAASMYPDHTIAHGEFGADMKVSLENNGPFTIVLDSEQMN